MEEALKGIKVIDFTLAGAGPSCTKLLAEYGADVIWVEPVRGSSTRSVFKFDFYTTGKRSIALNLKTPQGQEAMRRLVLDADVFVSNYRTRAVRNLALDYETLSSLNPRLIYATINGYGEEGPASDCPGYDPVAFWARSGALVDFAEKGSLLVPPVAVGDIATGQALAGGILAALLQRERTGKAERVFTSLLAEAMYLNHDAIVESQCGEPYPKSRLAPRRALLNTYRCGDGKWIVLAIAASFEHYFHPLLRAIGREDLVDDPRWTCMEDTMYEKAPGTVAMLDEAFAGMTQDEAVAALEAIDAPVSRVQTTVEAMQDPQVLENNYVYPLPAAGGGELIVPASPVKFGDKHSRTARPVRGPRLGEHSAEILAEYGYSPAEIKALLAAEITVTSGE